MVNNSTLRSREGSTVHMRSVALLRDYFLFFSPPLGSVKIPIFRLGENSLTTIVIWWRDITRTIMLISMLKERSLAIVVYIMLPNGWGFVEIRLREQLK